MFFWSFEAGKQEHAIWEVNTGLCWIQLHCGIHPTCPQPSRRPAISNFIAHLSSTVSIVLSDGWVELGGLHGPRSADCCGLLSWQCVGGVCCVSWYPRFPAGADLLLPHLPGGGWLPGGRGRRAAGCATRWLGECDPWPVSAPQLRCAGADSGLCAVAARYRRGPIPPVTHTTQVGANLIATLEGIAWYFKSNAWWGHKTKHW